MGNKRRRWLLLGCAARGAAQFADTRVFELGSSSKTNMLADAVVRDEAAGCLLEAGRGVVLPRSRRSCRCFESSCVGFLQSDGLALAPRS